MKRKPIIYIEAMQVQRAPDFYSRLDIVASHCKRRPRIHNRYMSQMVEFPMRLKEFRKLLREIADIPDEEWMGTKSRAKR